MIGVLGKTKLCCKSNMGYRGGLIITVIQIFLWLIVVTGVEGDRTFTKVYEPIEGVAACFKRLNGTDEIGCRSSSRGDVGVLHLVDNESSLQWVLKKGPHAPYIVIMYPDFFTRDHLLMFKSSERVNGVLLLPDNGTSPSIAKTPSAFSTDSTCPNNQFGIYNSSSPKYCPKWNSPGNSILFETFDFPIFFVRNETDVRTLINYYKTFNMPTDVNTAPDWPLCAGQLKSFMMAAKDTPTCIRRSGVFSINPATTKVCDPLGDQNLWATLLPQDTNSTTNQSKSALILASRFDGMSLFDEMSPSADSSVTGLVALLAVVQHLGKIKDQLVISPKSPINSIYFMIFNGEAFGYIGSSRIAYDMKRGEFPLKLNDIKYFLELNQVAGRNAADKTYFVHQSDIGQSESLKKVLGEQARLQNLSLGISSSEWGVPPSSLHSFLRERPDLTGLVITNHDNSYTNPYYNSIFDTKESVKYVYGDREITSIQQRIASLAATISNTIIQLVENGTESGFTAYPDLETVDELLHCYLETSNCSIFRSISGFDPPANSAMAPYPMYVGVSTYTNTITQLTKYIMVSYLGAKVENATNEDICYGRTSDSDPASTRPRFFFNHTCFDCPQINMTEAKSPAFLISDYDWSSGKYSTWTESVWQKFSVRIFLKPSLLHEILTLLSGVVVVLVSFVAVRFVSTKADLIFPSRTDAMVC